MPKSILAPPMRRKGLQDLVKRFCVPGVREEKPPLYLLGGFAVEGKQYNSSISALGKMLMQGDMLYVQFGQESALKDVVSRGLVNAFPIKYVSIHNHGMLRIHPKHGKTEHNVAEVSGRLNNQQLQIYWEIAAPDEFGLVKRLNGRHYAIVSVSKKP